MKISKWIPFSIFIGMFVVFPVVTGEWKVGLMFLLMAVLVLVLKKYNLWE